VHVIATTAKQLGYPALHPSELQSTARLWAPLCVVFFVAETPERDEVPPVGIGLRWCWTADSRVLPYLLSKLLTPVLSFASFSNFMTQAQHAVEEDLLLQHGPSQDTVQLSPLIRFCNSKDKPVKLPLITHPQLEPL